MKRTNRILAALLALVLVLSSLGSLSVLAASKNDAVRHQTCTALSAQAQRYYTGSYSFETLSGLSGKKTDSSVEGYGSDLYLALQKLMKTTLTNTVGYSSLTSYWATTDSAKGLRDAVLFYSDDDGSSTKYNREHVWPKSRGNFYQSGAGSDLHHLRPTDSGVNSARLHYTMGNVRQELDEKDISTYSRNGKTVLWYASLKDSYTENDCGGLVEINDNIKGDVARIYLYVYVTYGTASGDNLNLFTKTAPSGSGNQANDGKKVIESLDTLLQWCEMDPVDEWEMRRNDLCQDVQGNRNVFIDYPEFGWTLFGRDIPDMDTPSGYAHDLNTTSFHITAVSANPEMGEVSLTGRVITAIPAEGYYAADCTVSPADAAVVTRSGNRFVLSELKSDCTVTVTFAAKTAAAVTFRVPAGVTQVPLSAYIGDEVVLPTPTGTPTATEHAYSFLGWVAQSVSDTTEKPEFYKAGSTYTVTSANEMLYALYSYRVEDESGKTDTFTRVTADTDDFSGLYVVAAPDEGVMMNNDTSESVKFLGFTATTIANNTITCTNASCIFTVTKLGDYYTVQDANGLYLQCNGAKSITFTEAESVGTGDTSFLWTLSAAKGLTHYNGQYGTIQYNAGAPRFTNYTSTLKAAYLYRGGAPATIYYTTVLTGGHEHHYTPSVTAPTCTERGYTTYTCTECGESYVDDYTDALGHDMVTDAAAVPATCTETGLTEGSHCSRCDYVVAPTVTSALGHDYQETVVAATEEAGGYTEHTCSRCGDSYRDNETDPLACPSKDFTDVDTTKWYHEGVDFMLTNGYMAGTGDGTTFSPNAALTREMLAQILYAKAGKPEVTLTGRFTDVDADRWYAKAVEWAAEKGYVAGYPDGRFGVGDAVTREQLAVILYAYAEKPDADAAVLDGFADREAVSGWAANAMAWAVENGLISGTGSGLLAPKTEASRAQFAVIFRAYLTK